MSFTASTVGQKQPGCVFYSIHNSLESTNHRENGRPSLRPNIANKTPLYELAKCASMDSACVRVPQNGVHAFGQAVQNCLIALFVCGHSWNKLGQRGTPQHRYIFAFMEHFSLPVSISSPPLCSTLFFSVSKTAKALFRCSFDSARLLIFLFHA